MNLPQLLNKKYQEWETTETKTLTAFAVYLGTSQANLSRWMSGKSIPDGESISKIASKLGSEVYEALGMQPAITDDRLSLLNRVWDLLPEALKDEFANKAGRVQGQKRDGHKTKTRK